jgi:acyl-CoA thioester hydrolase
MEVRVIYADTDAMRITYHANYLKWFEMGRTEYLRELGFAYKDMEDEAMLMLPLTSSGMTYKKPAVYDDVLEIVTFIEKLGGASIRFGYEVYRKETGELLVTGHTAHGVTNTKLKPVRLKRELPELYQVLVESAAE